MCVIDVFVSAFSPLVCVLQREVLLLELSLFMVSHGNVQEAVDVLSRYDNRTPVGRRGQKGAMVTRLTWPWASVHCGGKLQGQRVSSL